ncbi:MAG TPA: IgGFc-binding protein, partial [Candidatus Kapabacteria bacterium]
MLRHLRIFLVFSLLLLGVAPVLSQGLKTAGTSFTFAIPEGADRVSSEFTPSRLALIIVSQYDGDGVVYSPSGVEIPFTFRANRAAQVELPHSLMHLYELGKTTKGILVRTTQPINLTYYLINPFASESSQIFPDDDLGTDYLVTGWGLWNDSSIFTNTYEDNRNQIVVISNTDGTDITITPKVNCLGGHSADVPINVTLNRGETFVLKADVFSTPVSSSLSNSSVRASKPVSVMMASTCAYVPLQQQACNPLIDHLLPISLSTDTIFYAIPPSDPKHDSRLVFISTTPQFFVVNSNGIVYQTTTGRIVVSLNNPDMFLLSAPAICHMLTSGTDNFPQSDPAIAPVLPLRNWGDTLLWLSPSFPFTFGNIINSVSLIYPTNDSDRVLLDGVPISTYPTRYPIPNSVFSALITPTLDGEHKVTSPVPVFSMMGGFDYAEAYLSTTTGVAPPLPRPVTRSLLVSSDTAKTCSTFTSSVSLVDPVLVSESVYEFRLAFIYDSKLMTPVTITPSSAIASISTIGSSSSDTISLVIKSTTPLVLSGELLTVTFDVLKTPQQTVLRASSAESVLDFGYLPDRRGSGQETIQIYESRGIVDAKLSIVLRSVDLGDTTSGQLYLETTMADTLSELRVRVRYDHDVMTIYSVKTTSTVLAGWSVVIDQIDFETDEFVYTHPAGAALVKGKGILGFLKATTYVTDTNATEIALSGFFTSASPCPLDVNALDTTGKFVGIDQCGDEYLHAYMKTTS